MSSEQSNAELRERAGVALQEAWDTGYLSDPAADRLADAVLAALGLDDLDAAVERMQVASGVPDPHEKYMLRLLLAALTPPEDERDQG